MRPVTPQTEVRTTLGTAAVVVGAVLSGVVTGLGCYYSLRSDLTVLVETVKAQGDEMRDMRPKVSELWYTHNGAARPVPPPLAIP